MEKPGKTVSLHICEQTSLALVPSPARIFQLDTAATCIALALQDGQSPAAVASLLAQQSGMAPARARRHVRALQQSLWPALGHSAPLAHEPAALLHWRPAAPGPGPGPGLVAEARHYRLLDRVFSCRFAPAPVLDGVQQALRHLEIPAGGAVDAAFEIGLQNRRLCVRSGAAQLDEEIFDDMALNALRLILTEASLPGGADWAIHAAAAQQGKTVILLPGAAGSGKSTLAFGLAAAGYTIFGDDTLALQGPALALRPLPFPLCLKQGSWGLAAEAANVIGGRRMDGMDVRWLPASEHLRLAAADARAAVSHIVFPKFKKNMAPHAKELGLDEALKRLLPAMHATGAGLTPEKTDRLIAWAGGCARHEIFYAHSDQALALLRELTA